jgi:hypothetical protein
MLTRLPLQCRAPTRLPLPLLRPTPHRCSASEHPCHPVHRPASRTAPRNACGVELRGRPVPGLSTPVLGWSWAGSPASASSLAFPGPPWTRLASAAWTFGHGRDQLRNGVVHGGEDLIPRDDGLDLRGRVVGLDLRCSRWRRPRFPAHQVRWHPEPERPPHLIRDRPEARWGWPSSRSSLAILPLPDSMRIAAAWVHTARPNGSPPPSARGWGQGVWENVQENGEEVELTCWSRLQCHWHVGPTNGAKRSTL